MKNLFIILIIPALFTSQSYAVSEVPDLTQKIDSLKAQIDSLNKAVQREQKKSEIELFRLKELKLEQTVQWQWLKMLFVLAIITITGIIIIVIILLRQRIRLAAE